MSTTNRASQNREYVRRLLKKKHPEFSAVLDRVVWELTYTCDAPSAESPARRGPRADRQRYDRIVVTVENPGEVAARLA